MDNLLSFLQEMKNSPRATSGLEMLRNIDSIFESVQNKWSAVDEEVRGLLGPEQHVDEMALYFTDFDALVRLMAKAVRRGWVVFNQDEDQVDTKPIVSTYGVEYWFLRHPELPYRLELMHIPDGFSPYHQGMREYLERNDMCLGLAHASFKVPDEVSYARAVVALRSAGYELLQHCTSTYGRFSYYANVSEGSKLPIIKPRINIRDGAEEDE
jgi:hypothetical protein